MDDLYDLMYSEEASATRYLFYQDLNDINIFVEDLNMEFLYETIFKRMLKDKYNIYNITSLGGKPNVIAKFNEFGTETNGVPNIYIVDGDFDRYIYKDKIIHSPNFIYLETYNIETYFIDENACLKFAKGKLKCFDKIVKEKVNFNYWKNRIVKESSKLFLCYCFVQTKDPTIATLSRSHYDFLDFKTGFERNDGAFKKYWKSISHLSDTIEDDIRDIDKNYKKINGNDYLNLICGKFLFTSLYCYMRNITGVNFNKDDFEWNLINDFDIKKLDYIKNQIVKLAT